MDVEDVMDTRSPRCGVLPGTSGSPEPPQPASNNTATIKMRQVMRSSLRDLQLLSVPPYWWAANVTISRYGAAPELIRNNPAAAGIDDSTTYLKNGVQPSRVYT